MERRRKIFGLILLAVMLPAVLAVPFHHHSHDRADRCANCESIPHHLHLAPVNGPDQCLVCQFLTISWEPSEQIIAPSPVPESSPVAAELTPSPTEAAVTGIPARAPPVVFF